MGWTIIGTLPIHTMNLEQKQPAMEQFKKNDERRSVGNIIIKYIDQKNLSGLQEEYIVWVKDKREYGTISILVFVK